MPCIPSAVDLWVLRDHHPTPLSEALRFLMADPYRWTRTFANRSTFSDDLGSLGVWVGPRTGAGRRTQDQKEDYVLRRLLIAWKQRGTLRFPLIVQASDQVPHRPDFLLEDEDGRRGLEVTEAGSEAHQQLMTETARQGRESYLVSEDGYTATSIVHQLRSAIRKKVDKFDKGSYREPCELAVYNNTEDGLDDEIVKCVNDPSLHGPFDSVNLLDCDGNRVYTNVLSDAPQRIDIAADYDIDLARWTRDQIDFLRQGKLDRLDVENLIEELEALARRDRRELRSHLGTLFTHLLKWECQPERRGGSWASSVQNSCDEIAGLVEESPSLRQLLDPDGELVGKAYANALKRAASETGLSSTRFPPACPWRGELESACGDRDESDPLRELRREVPAD